MIDDIEDAARALLLQMPRIVELVGDRIFADQLPLGDGYPAITIQLISGIHTKSPLMAAADPDAIDTTLQITAWAPSKPDTKKVTRAIRETIRRWRGNVDGFEIWDINIALEGPNFRDNELNLFASVTDYVFSHPR